MRISVIGSGAWGTVLAQLLADQGHTVVLWCRRPDVANALTVSRVHPNRPAWYPMHPAIQFISCSNLVPDSDGWVWAIPSLFSGSDSLPFPPSGIPVLSVTKGIVSSSPIQTMSEHLRDRGMGSIAVLSGPNLAREIDSGLPTASVVASSDSATAEFFASVLHCARFRVYVSSDVIGVEWGGIIKNVIAIAAGMCDGLALGCNAKSALLTRALSDMGQLMGALGAATESVYGLSGLGDLLTTAWSPASRNYQVGYRLATGVPASSDVSQQLDVAEGVRSAPMLVQLGDRLGLKLPIIRETVGVLTGAYTPVEAVNRLMLRDPNWGGVK